MSWVHPPRKQLGQNFLQDPTIISGILQAARLKSTDRVVEIGPGRGALTLPLLRHLSHLIAIELDTDLYAHWSNYDKTHLTVIHADALTVDYRQWGGPIRIIGNLPYHISTPLLIHLLTQREVIQDITVMLQKEVVDRLCAQPGTKAYGRLTVIMQAYCHLSWVLDAPPEAFYPQPKVMSSVVNITPLPLSAQPSVAFTVLEKLVKQAFGMRRKTLANNLKAYFSSEDLEKQGINPKARPEEISVGEYINLACKW